MIANKLINNANCFYNTSQFAVISNNESYSDKNENFNNFYILLQINNYNGEVNAYIYSNEIIYNNILNSSKKMYEKLYNKKFDFSGYKSYLAELKKLPLTSSSKIYLYNDSVRLNINYKTKIFFIEYFKNENLLIVTSKTDNLKMKEAKIDSILKTMESFF